jgi:hypothetical protein
VFTGSGTAGAYHAGVLRAFAEAGVKIDVIAGAGMGVATALFAAIDGGNRLWEPAGLWRGPAPRAFYRLRGRHRVALWVGAVALVLLGFPLLLSTIAGLLWLAAFLLNLASDGAGAAPAAASADLIALTTTPGSLMAILPRLITLALFVLAVLICFGWMAGGTRGSRPGGTRLLSGASALGPPLESGRVANGFAAALWHIMRGAAAIGQPPPRELSRRYTELLAENLGQPGFREILLTAHDLDARRDLVFGLLAEPLRRRFAARAGAPDADGRHAEAIDLAGTGRDHALDALAGALSVPMVSDPHPISFAAESFWRGETHRICHRPGAVVRLMEELVGAGVEQVIVVSPAAEVPMPHMLTPGRRDDRGHVGEHLAALEVASVRDAVAGRRSRFQGVFQIRSLHNPVGPFDFDGAYDSRSDRTQTLSELIDRGYEDAYRQFIDPVFAVSGETMDSKLKV